MTASKAALSRERALWQIVRLSVGVACLALLTNTWLIEGLFLPLITVSGSMAPALLGPHFDITCAKCGRTFACDSQSQPADWRGVCPNCGFAEIARFDASA